MVVILPDEEVSTTIAISYSINFGITASVRLEPHAPIMHGHLVAGNQFFSDGGSLGRIALVVFDDQFDFFAENSTLRVDLVGGDFGAVDDVGAGSCERARKGLVHADLNGLGTGGATHQSEPPVRSLEQF